ncbi:trigger factor, partial [Microbacterium schleiferi]|uniref:trigger factor n=1 Tax=Microbacterium schleiferi TaxID=69362 RepID=UPI0035C7D7C2
TLPALDSLTVEIEAVEVDDAAVDAELDKLRARFGTLITVDRPATSGDFVELDLVATIDGSEIDRAEGVSYEVGSGELLEGIDEAIESLTAGEDTTFRSKLVGGDHAGEEAEVAVTVTSVKERELPEADDDFAQIASEFDTIAELRESLRTTASQQSGLQQTSAARDKLVDLLLEQVEIPVPAGLIEDEVHQHLEGEGRLEDDEHRAEVTEASEKQFRTQMILDKLTETYDVKVSQDELTQYLIQSAAQYGMSPQDFVNAIQQGNQLPAMVGEVARSKALVHALRDVKIVDTTGAAVDLSAHLILGEDEAEAEEEVVEEAQGIADAAADADEIIEAEEKPAPKKRAPRKSTKADAE